MKMWFTESHYTATDMMTAGPGLVFAITFLVKKPSPRRQVKGEVINGQRMI